MEDAEASGVAPVCDVPVPDWEEFGYTPAFLAKSAQTIEKARDAFRSLQRVAKSEGKGAPEERLRT